MLEQIPFFQRLNEAELKRLKDISILKKYKKGEFLSNPHVSLQIIKSLSQKLKITSELIHQELVLNSEAKVARFLVNNADLFNELKHFKIASILNITPETFSRILAKFKAQNLIALDANNEILDIATNELSKMFES